jgi:hypothetical protein
MPSTISLERTVNYAQRFVRNSPLTFVNEGDPAFLSADWVRQFILAPPFAWRWNRAYVSPITCAIGVPDYKVNLPDFGWIEKAWLNFPIIQGQQAESIELEVEMVVAGDQKVNQPTKITANLDDDNGNITFRMFPPPDTTYTLNIIYQKAAPKFGSLTDMWSPLPDFMSYIYTQGFLAKTYEYFDDAKFPIAMQTFFRQVVAANDGLTETEKNIFLSDRLVGQDQQQNASQTGQIARSARAGA